MNRPAPLLVIVNYAAARARLAWPGVRETLTRSGLPFEAHETRWPGDASSRTRAALDEGYRTIAALGGDGTLSEVASGFFERGDETEPDKAPRVVNPEAALAVLPAGTGDDFARGLSGGRRAVLDEWVRKLIAHQRSDARGETPRDSMRRVDVLDGSVGGGAQRFISINAVTLGIGAEVAARVAAQKGALRRLPGEARFAWAALGALAAWRERLVRIRVDEGEWRECPTNLIAITNGAYAGGGMNFSPAARVDDGRLDVVTACGITRAAIVRELTRIHRGGHLANPRVSVETGRRVRVEVRSADGRDALGLEADGDVRGETPVEIRVLRGALRVVV